jgi:hypothetical protein
LGATLQVIEAAQKPCMTQAGMRPGQDARMKKPAALGAAG